MKKLFFGLLFLFTAVLYSCGQQVTVSFVTNGGTAIENVSVTQGAKFSVTKETTYEGHKLDGWFYDEELTEEFKDGDIINRNITLYAKWSVLKFEVTIVNKEESRVEEVEYNKDVILDSITDDHFKGWSHDGKNIKKDMTIKAIYEYTLTFKDGEDTVFERKVEYGKDLIDIPSLERFEEEGKNVSWDNDGKNVKEDRVINLVKEDIKLKVTYKYATKNLTEDEKVIYKEHTYEDIIYGSTLESIPAVDVSLLDENEHNNFYTYWNFELSNFPIKKDYNVELMFIPKKFVVSESIVLDYYYLLFVGQDGYITNRLDTQPLEGATTSVISIDSPLWTPTNEKYNFSGWFKNKELTTELTAGNYNISDLFTTDKVIYLYSSWIKKEKYAKPEINTATYNKETKDITINFKAESLNGTYPENFIISINNEDIEKNIINDGEGNYSVVINRNLLSGIYQVKVKVAGTDTVLSSEYSDLKEILVTASNTSFEDGTAEKEDYYIRIKNKDNSISYIFYSNMRYEFTAGNNFEIIDNPSDVISAENNVLTTTSNSGIFTFENNGKLYTGKVIPNIGKFSLGTNLSSFEKNKEKYILQEDKKMEIGYQNDAIFDIRALDNKGNIINNNNLDLVFKFRENGAYIGLDDGIYVVLENNNFRFTEAAVGKTIEVEVEPRYQANKFTINSLKFEFKVNNGYNVYTHEQFETLYARSDVQKINFLSSIVASLSPDKLNPDGTPIDLWGGDYDIIGHAYTRIIKDRNDDNLVINGNYFTIDGKNLPLVKPTDSNNIGVGFKVAAVQVGILYYNAHNNSDFSIVEGKNYTDNDAFINDNKITINDLSIIGNTRTPYVNYADEESAASQEELMSKNSGGYIALRINNGNSELNNLNLGFGVLGIMNNAFGKQTNGEPVTGLMNNLSIDNIWANSIYSYGGSKLVLNNSKIGSSGGASIHIEDARGNNDESIYNDPSFYLNNNNEINNWVDGSEAWFVAYGMASIALGIKTQLSAGLEDFGLDVIKEIKNDVTGLMSEKMNFVLMTKPMKNANIYTDETKTTLASASRVKIVLVDGENEYISYRGLGYKNGDPRYSNGTFIAPMGRYSDVVNILSIVNANNQNTIGAAVGVYLATTNTSIIYNYIQNVLVPFAFMRNLTAEQAVDYLINNNQNVLDSPFYPYLEVGTGLPTLGDVTVILGLFNRE